MQRCAIWSTDRRYLRQSDAEEWGMRDRVDAADGSRRPISGFAPRRRPDGDEHRRLSRPQHPVLGAPAVQTDHGLSHVSCPSFWGSPSSCRSRRWASRSAGGDERQARCGSDLCALQSVSRVRAILACVENSYEDSSRDRRHRLACYCRRDRPCRCASVASPGPSSCASCDAPPGPSSDPSPLTSLGRSRWLGPIRPSDGVAGSPRPARHDVSFVSLGLCASASA